MTLNEAYGILGIKSTASEAERHAVFETKQKALEAKLGKAPTPGLKEKYRQALKQLEEAIETVEMAADGGLLPTLAPEREAEADVGVPAKVREGGAKADSAGGAKVRSSKPKQGFGKEIGVMVVVCLLMAGAAYWWFGIEQPKRAVVAYDAITVQIEALAETASDDELSDAERLLAEYLRTASAGHQAQANALFRERKNAVQSYRAVETARLEAEHLAEEKRLIDAKAKAEAEQKSLGRKVTKDLNALKVEASKLKAILGDAEDRLRDLKNAERDSAREDDGLRKTYDRIRRSRYEDYVNWLENYERIHPVKLAISNADDLARSSDLQAALESVESGVKSVEDVATKIESARMGRYESALSKWVLTQSDPRVIKWLRVDESQVMARAVDELRGELSYLDNSPGKSNVLKRLDVLALISGKDDPDYVRWLDQVLPDLKIESDPSGSTVTDSTGRVLGKTPLFFKNHHLGLQVYSLSIDGYRPGSLNCKLELNEGEVIKRVSLGRVPKPKAGQSWTVNLSGSEKIEMIYVKSGSFMMGSSKKEKKREKNEVQHRVTLTQGYWLGKYEVTQGQWQAVMGGSVRAQRDKANGELPIFGEGSRHPMYYVTWEEVMEFCRKLTARERAADRLATDLEYVLPTEAQWEYACRAGTQTPFHYGSRLDSSQENFNGDYPYGGASKGPYRETTLSVGSFKPNTWGFYDMHGNVWEWCSDWFGEYPSGNVTNPRGANSGPFGRVNRGGSWFSDARRCRSAYRGRVMPGGHGNLGFRLALVSVR